MFPEVNDQYTFCFLPQLNYSFYTETRLLRLLRLLVYIFVMPSGPSSPSLWLVEAVQAEPITNLQILVMRGAEFC